MPKKFGRHLNLGFLAVLTGLSLLSLLSYRAATEVAAAVQARSTLRSRIMAEEMLLSTIKDAESGQRGYLLTGRKRYLLPYHQATESASARLDELQSLVRGDPS